MKKKLKKEKKERKKEIKQAGKKEQTNRLTTQTDKRTMPHMKSLVCD